jgi:hypothetical protein
MVARRRRCDPDQREDLVLISLVAVAGLAGAASAPAAKTPPIFKLAGWGRVWLQERGFGPAPTP